MLAIVSLICLTATIITALCLNTYARRLTLREARQAHEVAVFKFSCRQYEEQAEQRRIELHMHAMKHGLPTPADVMKEIRKRAEDSDVS